MKTVFLATLLASSPFVSIATADDSKWTYNAKEMESIRVPVTFSAVSGKVILSIDDSTGHQLVLTPSKSGNSLRANFQMKGADGKWESHSDQSLSFWPGDSENVDLNALKEDGIEARNCMNRPLMLRIDLSPASFKIWLEGRLVAMLPGNIGKSAIRLSAAGAATVGERKMQSFAAAKDRFELVELPNQSEGKGEVAMFDGVPFELRGGALSLKDAGWPDWKRDPAGFNQAYDGGPYFVGDKRMPSTQIPNAGYAYAYVLARSKDEPDTTNRFTLRIGRRVGGYGERSQVIQRDYTVEVKGDKAIKVGGVDGYYLIKVPIHELFPLLVEGDKLDVEITKEIRLARRSPDPNSFRWRPLGLPSNVEIAAITLEKSPLQMAVKFPHLGNVFEKEVTPKASITLKNISSEPVKYRLAIAAGDDWNDEFTGVVAGGESLVREVQSSRSKLGIRPFNAQLKDEAGNLLLDYRTTYGVLPEYGRKYRNDSAFGIGGVGVGGHFTWLNGDEAAELVAKLGYRHVNGLNVDVEHRRKHGLLMGTVLSSRPGNGGADKILERWDERLAQHPDQPPQLLVFHEDGISGRHGSRVPDIFTDRPQFQLDEAEKERFAMMVDLATRTGKLFREKYPHVQIELGNGGPVVREELYRSSLSKELFDTAGNENPTFSRMPETQPPDSIGNNSSLWMDRQMLDHYGLGDRKITQCHETIYPSTNPGNLSEKTHADYLVRHFLHSLSWGIPQIRAAGLADKGNSYRNSNWGQTGLFTARPEMAPKQTALRMAVLTKVLDGAAYEGFLDMESDSVYVLHFKLRDGGAVFPFWTVRGERSLEFEVSEKGSRVLLITPGGEEEVLKPVDGRYTVTATASTAFLKLESGMPGKIALGAPKFPTFAPKGKVSNLGPLKLEDWTVAEDRNPLMEFYNPITPRRKGNFAFTSVPEFEGKSGVVKVLPGLVEGGKPTMPMYAELVPAKAVELPGKPTEIGFWVNGNSSWGRLIFELEDASGQKWTSIGARAKKGGSPWMADWLGKKLAEEFEPGEKSDWNTDDAWGLSRINFDGWNLITMPLPGNYPGEAYGWPANSQWRSDKGGIVKYPLKLTRVIVELPEKTLYLSRFEPAKRPEIYLGDLLTIEDSRINEPKLTPYERVPSAQVQID